MKSKAIFLALLAFAFGARAVPVSVEQAKGVARAWARRSMAMQTLIGETVENVSYDVTSNGAPFYAVKMGASLLDVMGGCLTNTDQNVLDAEYRPIPGLYAIGNCCGGMYGVDYPLLLNGNSYGRAFSYALNLGQVLSGTPDE